MTIRITHIAKQGSHPKRNLRSKRSRVYGFAASLFASLGRRRGKVTQADLKRADFPVCPGRRGLRFTERVRDVFRFRWIKKSR